MYILSQDKTRIYNMSGHIEGIGYEESKDYKQRKTENIRHTIQVFDGCAEEIAEFKTKETGFQVLFNVKSINAASDVAGRDVVIYMTALDGRRFDYAGRRYIERI